MRRNLLYILCLLLFGISCTNKKSPVATNTDDAKRDSLIAEHRQDSIEREQRFSSLGDTVFGTILYGMNKSQFKQAFNSFKNPLKKEGVYAAFIFAGYKFMDTGASSVEEDREISINGYPYGLENVKTEERIGTRTFNNKLFAVEWCSYREMGSYNIVVKDLQQLVGYFRKRYGKPNMDNSEKFNSPTIETGVWHQMKVVAKWETASRKITIFYRECVGSERDKYMDEEYPLDYQYYITIQFLNKDIKKEVDEYITSILQKFAADVKRKELEESIRMENAL